MPERAGARRAVPPVRSWFFRTSVSHVVIGLLVALVVASLIWQVRSRGSDNLATARRADLVSMLDQLTEESRRLEQEKARLEQTRRELETGADKQRVAQEEAARRTEAMGILNGTLPARGPGIVVTVADPARKVDGALVLDAVQELRDAGAEVIEIDDLRRVVASTWFGTQDGDVTVDGVRVARPLRIDAIGDPQTLEEGVSFRGGIVSQVRGLGGEVTITRSDDVWVDSLATPRPFVQATPRR